MFWAVLLLFVGPPEVLDAAPELPVKVVGPSEPVPVGRLVKLTPEGPEGTDFGWGMPVGDFEVAQQSNLPVLFYSAEQPGRVLFVLQAVKCGPAGEKPAKTLVFYWLDVVGGDWASSSRRHHGPSAPRVRCRRHCHRASGDRRPGDAGRVDGGG
jgi:hypothetical protein